MMRATLTGAVATARVAFATDCTTTPWSVTGVTPLNAAEISIAAAGTKWAMKYGEKLFQTEGAAISLHDDLKVAGVKVFMAGTTPVCAKEKKFTTAAKATEAAKEAEINIKDVVAAGTETGKFVIVGDKDSTGDVTKKAFLVTATDLTLAAIESSTGATGATAKKLVSATTIGASLYAISDDKMEKVETVGSPDANKAKFVNVAYTLKKGEENVTPKSLDIIEANGQALVLAYTDNADKSHIAVAADASVAAPAFVVKADLEGKPSAVMPKGESTYVVIGEKLYVVKGSTVTELLDKVKAAALAGETLRLGRATGTPEKTNLFEAPIATCPKPPTPAVTTTTTAKVTTTATGTTKSGSTLATVSSAALVAAAAVLII